MATIPALGTFWRRKPPGSQTVKVIGTWYRHGRWTVRAAPVRGGPALVMDADTFTLDEFRPIPDPLETPSCPAPT